MKHRLCLLLFACAFLLLLSACAGGKETVEGKVSATQTEDGAGLTAILTTPGKVKATQAKEGGGLTAFLVQPDPGSGQKETIGILLTDKTEVLAAVNGLAPQDFLTGVQGNVAVSVRYQPYQPTTLTLDGAEVKAYKAKEVTLTGYRTDKTITLKDGTVLSLWQHANATGYALEDGTELLTCRNTAGPNNTYDSGTDFFEDMAPAAQKAVSAYYQEQGSLYDLPAQLEQAYEAYRQTEDPKAFLPHRLAQEIIATASNDTLLCFQTEVTFPIDGKTVYTQQIGTVFDRNTGEQIDMASLFTCPKEELGSRLLDISTVSDPTLLAEMEKAFQPEYITLYPDHIQLCFPQGTLPSQEHTFLWDIDYKGELSKLMEPWAIPKAPDKG